MKKIYKADPSKIKPYKLRLSLWLWNVVILPGSILLPLGFCLIGNKPITTAAIESMFIMFLILISIFSSILLLVYLLVDLTDAKIIHLTEESIISETRIYQEPQFYEIKYADIERIKLRRFGFTVFKRGQKMIRRISRYEQTDKYIKVIMVPIVTEDYEKLLDFLQSKARINQTRNK